MRSSIERITFQNRLRSLAHHGGRAFVLGAVLLLAACGTTEQAVPASLDDLVATEPDRAIPTLRGDPGFDAGSLVGEVAVWHERVLATVADPGDDLDPLGLAGSDDLYMYGRTLQLYVQSVLVAFRMTGDLALLDHVDEIAERMRGELDDSWRDTKDGSDGERDGYLNWVWRYSSGDSYVGKDTNELDEMKTHALVAMIAVALDANRDLTSPGGRDYGAHADFWEDYLVNDFEAKWREREEVPSGFPIMTRPHMNVYLSWLKWHYYMGVLTGDGAYLDEAAQMADYWWDEIRAVDTSSGTVYVWSRSLLGLGGSQDALQSTGYASGVVADVVELHLEGFHRWASAEEMRRFARTFTEFVIDNDDPLSNGFAPDIGGGYDRAGLSSENTKRLSLHAFWLSGYPLLAAWDETGMIADLTARAHERRGSNVGMMLESGGLVYGTLGDSYLASAMHAPN